MARSFAEVLGVPVATREANFFALGGHSLVAMRIADRFRPAPVHLLFEHPTVAAYAAALDSTVGEGSHDVH